MIYVNPFRFRLGCLVRSFSNLSLRVSNSKSQRISKFLILCLSRDKTASNNLAVPISDFHCDLSIQLLNVSLKLVQKDSQCSNHTQQVPLWLSLLVMCTLFLSQHLELFNLFQFLFLNSWISWYSNINYCHLFVPLAYNSDIRCPSCFSCHLSARSDPPLL